MPKDNKAKSVARLKVINTNNEKRLSKKPNNRKEHDTGGKDLQGRRK